MELLTIHCLGTSITLPWEAETIEEEEKKMKPAVEESNFTSPELIITDEQGKHSTNIKQGCVKVQNIGYVPVNNAEHCTIGEMSNSSDKLCNDSDISTQPLQKTQDHMQTNKHKGTTKVPKMRSDDFYGVIEKTIYCRLTLILLK